MGRRKKKENQKEYKRRSAGERAEIDVPYTFAHSEHFR